MKTVHAILISFIVLVFYWAMANIYASIDSFPVDIVNKNLIEKNNNGMQMTANDRAVVVVNGLRWYGSIITISDSIKADINIYLLNIIRVPLQAHGTNLIMWHIIILATVGVFILSVSISNFLLLDNKEERNNDSLVT